MQRRETSWRFGVLAAFVVLAVAALGAGAGQSALGGAAQSGVLVSGTTDSVTNIDPAGNYDYGSATLGFNIFEHLYDARNSAKIVPSLATGCAPRGNTRDVALHAPAWRHVPRRLGVRLGGREVLVRPGPASAGHQGGGCEHAVAAAHQPQERRGPTGSYAVTFNLKAPQSTWRFILTTGAAGIVPSSVYPANHLQKNNQPQIGTGPYRLTRYTPGQQAVFEPYDDYWGPQARNDGLILRYYSKSSTMKLALERGEIDMAFQTFTPTELTSLGSSATYGCTRARARSSDTSR